MGHFFLLVQLSRVLRGKSSAFLLWPESFLSPSPPSTSVPGGSALGFPDVKVRTKKENGYNIEKGVMRRTCALALSPIHKLVLLREGSNFQPPD